MRFKSIKIHINSNNQGLVNAIRNVIPAKDDPMVDAEGYNIQEGPLSPFDYNFFMADIQFKEEIDRDTVLKNIKGLDGVIHACLPGSQIVGYTQKHGEGLSCEEETVLETI
jgi:hypothetical protein